MSPITNPEKLPPSCCLSNTIIHSAVAVVLIFIESTLRLAGIFPGVVMFLTRSPILGIPPKTAVVILMLLVPWSLTRATVFIEKLETYSESSLRMLVLLKSINVPAGKAAGVIAGETLNTVLLIISTTVTCGKIFCIGWLVTNVVISLGVTISPTFTLALAAVIVICVVVFPEPATVTVCLNIGIIGS